MAKRGMTLVELIVAMTIFITVMTLAIGGFVAISRSRMLIGNMKETQQKIRIANEMIVRYSKQAEYIKINDDGRVLELYFDLDLASRSAKKFSIVQIGSSGKYDLKLSECVPTALGVCPTGWVAESGLLGVYNDTKGGITLIDDGEDKSSFGISGVLPSVLEVTLVIQNTVPSYPSLSDQMTIKNAIILESLK